MRRCSHLGHSPSRQSLLELSYIPTSPQPPLLPKLPHPQQATDAASKQALTACPPRGGPGLGQGSGKWPQGKPCFLTPQAAP